LAKEDEMRRIMTMIVVLWTLGCGAEEGSNGGMTVGYDSVTVVSNAFMPPHVHPNDVGVVVWTWNSGGVTHNVTFEDAGTGSGDQNSGAFSRTFTTPGIYRFRCTIHSTAFGSGMSGSVVLGTAEPPDPKDPYDPPIPY
jgi:plastocyanin